MLQDGGNQSVWWHACHDKRKLCRSHKHTVNLFPKFDFFWSGRRLNSVPRPLTSHPPARNTRPTPRRVCYTWDGLAQRRVVVVSIVGGLSDAVWEHRSGAWSIGFVNGDTLQGIAVCRNLLRNTQDFDFCAPGGPFVESSSCQSIEGVFHARHSAESPIAALTLMMVWDAWAAHRCFPLESDLGHILQRFCFVFKDPETVVFWALKWLSVIMIVTTERTFDCE